MAVSSQISVARIIHSEALPLAWKNKTITSLSKPHTKNIHNGNIGVLLEMSLHELYSQHEKWSINGKHECKMRNPLYFEKVKF